VTLPSPRPHEAHTARAALAWLSAYVIVVVAPLFALLPGPAAGRGFPWDLSMALGYAAMSMFGVQFWLTARFKRATAPFGIDIVYYFHRYLALFALALALVHVIVLAAAHPAAIAWDPREAPAHVAAGMLSLVLLVTVAVLSIARQRLRIAYEPWRWTHALLATLGFALAAWHLFGSGRYLDTAWKQALWAAYLGFWAALIVHVRLVRPWGVLRRPWRVQVVRPEHGQVWTLVLEPAAERTPPLHFSPGQFAWLTLRASPLAMREHPFSLASSSDSPRRVELSIKALGDFSASIGSVQPGETAWLDAPYGTFGVDRCPHAQSLVFVAGGIGIAPILSMLRTLADRADRRPMLLVYGNRVWNRVAFREEVDALARRLDLRIVHTLLEPPADWRGEQGFVTQAVLARHLPPAGQRCEVFICGPTPMTTQVEQALAALKLPPSHVHSEIFDWV
jgi:predicted ferric reductase